MTNTIREQIIQAFAARAQSLSDLPVERALRSIGETNEKFISIWDGEDQALEAGYGIQKMQFPIVLECVYKAGPLNPSVAANALMGNVIKTIFTGSHTFSNLASAMNLASAAPSYPMDGSDYSTVFVTFNIIYTTKKGDPFTLAP